MQYSNSIYLKEFIVFNAPFFVLQMADLSKYNQLLKSRDCVTYSASRNQLLFSMFLLANTR